MEALIEFFVRILVTLFVLFFGISQEVGQEPAVPPTPAGVEEMYREDVTLENVQINVMESFPVQVRVDITVGHNGCQAPIQTLQGQNGSVITIEVYRELPAESICPMMLVLTEVSVDLGTLQPGDYQIIINGEVYEISV